jgi:AraC-like DNA-binding protein
VAIFTCTHAFFYIIGPFSFFYVRGLLRDNSQLDKKDFIHFLLFLIVLVGYIPYFFSGWDYKLFVANNIQSESWDMAKFHLNLIVPHKVDQALIVLQIYFYSAALWYLIWKYKRSSSSSIYNVPQYKLIRNWLFVFTLIISIIAINFTFAMANMWLYNDKTIFLAKASYALLFASVVYVGMNMIVMIFPHIMYGLPIEMNAAVFIRDIPANNRALTEVKQESVHSTLLPILSEMKELPLLFSQPYIDKIEWAINDISSKGIFLEPDFNLIKMAEISGLPSHHLTFYFNSILDLSFSNWRNKLRIEYAINLLNNEQYAKLTIEAISQKCGFIAQNTFIRSFKNYTQKTPSDYIKNLSTTQSFN